MHSMIELPPDRPRRGGQRPGGDGADPRPLESAFVAAEPAPTGPLIGAAPRPEPRKGRPAWLEILMGILGVLALGWVVVIGGRWAAARLALALPYSVDRSIGELAAKEYDTSASTCTNPVLVGAVQEIVTNLEAGLLPEHRGLVVKVIDDSAVNAFALPGGYLFILTGLLQELATPEELIGVLGHEVGHAVKRHGLQRIAEAVWWKLVLSQIIGDVFGLSQVMADGALGLLSSAFGRDHERESDTFGLGLMHEAGYAAGTFPDFFDRLPASGLPDWAQTHPDPGERAQTLRAAIAAMPPPASLRTPPPLASLKAPCFGGGAPLPAAVPVE